MSTRYEEIKRALIKLNDMPGRPKEYYELFTPDGGINRDLNPDEVNEKMTIVVDSWVECVKIAYQIYESISYLLDDSVKKRLDARIEQTDRMVIQSVDRVSQLGALESGLRFIHELEEVLREEIAKILQGGDNSGNDKITILFLAANPVDSTRIRLDREFREIDEQLALARQRERFKLELPRLALRSRDITKALLDTKPQIVHFSGHGTSRGELCFEDESGQIHSVQPEALAALFKQFTHQVKCVVLNACYAEIQARAIAEHIDYVIGVNQRISDEAAIAFSLGFYMALGAGKTIKEAFEFGRIQIMLQNGVSEHLAPMLIKKGQSQ